MKVVDVVCAVLKREERFLLARRAPHKNMAGFWEFPGGKVEHGESPEEALQRELLEELGIQVQVGAYITTVEEQSAERCLRLHAYFAVPNTDTLTLVDHDRTCRAARSGLGAYKLCPPDRPLLDFL